ncbi:hypothetical protein V3C99_004052 [Haemonchus contortus]
MRSLLEVFLGYLTITAVSCTTCVQLNSRNHCVHKGPDKRSWEQAEAYCESRSGHLTSIHNKKDIAVIKSLGDPDECKSYWTGGQCRYDTCSWKEGSAFNFRKIRRSHAKSAYQCIESLFEKGSWRPSDCSKKNCFVCETSEVMSDCADWYKAGYKDDGIYSIVINGTTFKVFCDMHTAGGGWVVFQRRINDSDPFWNHTWSEYKNGFGSMGSNSTFWLVNEALHQLTYKDPNVTLRVEMRGDRTPRAKNPNGFWWNHYFSFRVGSEETDYTLEKLSIEKRNIKGNASIGRYDMSYSIGAKFSTIDRINDPLPECITRHKMGGWWLRNCAMGTLNGAYKVSDYSGLFWMFNGTLNAIRPSKTVMMLKPSLNTSHHTST